MANHEEETSSHLSEEQTLPSSTHSEEPTPNKEQTPPSSTLSEEPTPNKEQTPPSSPSAEEPQLEKESTPSKRDGKRKLLENGDTETDVLVADDGGASKKRALFERIWSDEDEKAILKALAEFTSETGLDPYREASTFHGLLKKSASIHVEISTGQLKEKIRRIRKKFRNVSLGKSKSLDKEAFELAQKVWAREENAEPSHGLKVKEDWKGLAKMNDSGGFHEFLDRGMRLIDRSRMAELEKLRKKMHAAEVKAYLKRVELVRYLALSIAEAYTSSN